MDVLRRRALLNLASLCAGCTIEPLAPLRTRPIDAPATTEPVMRAPAVGQAWTYRKTNFYNRRLLAIERESVVAVNPRIVVQRTALDTGTPLPQELQAEWGQLLRDPAWDLALNFDDPLPLWPRPLSAGTAVNLHSHYRLDGGSFRYWINVYATVKGWENIALAQGGFDTVRVERLLRLQHPDSSRLDLLRRDTLWLAPGIGRWVARETRGEYRIAGRGGGTGREDYFRWELTDWQ